MDVKKDKEFEQEYEEQVRKIRLTLRGRNVKHLESACAQVVSRSKGKGYKTRGPVRIPTKHLNITTRCSPCGNGTNTWDRFEMHVHKRVLDIYCPSAAMQEITDFRIDPSVDTHLSIFNEVL